VFGLCDRLRLRRRAGDVVLFVSRGMLSHTYGAGDQAFRSDRIWDKADRNTERFEVDSVVH